MVSIRPLSGGCGFPLQKMAELHGLQMGVILTTLGYLGMIFRAPWDSHDTFPTCESTKIATLHASLSHMYT